MGKLRFFLTISFLTICIVVANAFPLGSGGNDNKLYEPKEPPVEKLAALPVEQVKLNLEKRNWHVLNQSFASKTAYEKFANKFNMIDPFGKSQAGCFGINFLTPEIVSVTPAGSGIHPDFTIKLVIKKDNNINNAIEVNFHTAFDVISLHYLIVDMYFVGDLVNIDCKGPPQPPNLQEFEPVCGQNRKTGFTYIKLRNRKDNTSAANNALLLGENTNADNIYIPDDLSNAVAFRQIPFPDFTYDTPEDISITFTITISNPLYDACRLLFSDNFCSGTLGLTPSYTINQTIQIPGSFEVTYNPGYVISLNDFSNNEITPYISSINDADGLFYIPDNSGSWVSRPTGFLLDRKWKKVVAVSNENDAVHYGLHSGEYHFNKPTALTASGKFIYILDESTVNTIVVLQCGLNASDEFTFTTIGNTDFGVDLSYASDITSFENVNENILYISNTLDHSITSIILDKNTGLQKSGAPAPLVIREAEDFEGNKHALGGVVFLESSPRNSVTGQNVIMATIGQNEIAAYSTNALSATTDMTLNFKYIFPQGTGLRNIGYNLGNNSFYVTDNRNHKIHIFSSEGEYIGSGGVFGHNETGNELYYPNVISSNTFTSSTKEMVVVNELSNSTGMKKIVPLADISNIDVFEKAPVTLDFLNQNSLDFRFSLTDGEGVDDVMLNLNGNNIKTISSPGTTFIAGIYSNNFLIDYIGATGILNHLVVGWNTYTVTLDAHIDDGASAMNYQRTKTIEFYWVPSSFRTDFTADNSSASDLNHNLTDDPFVIYKNVWVPGGNTPAGIHFTLKNGKTTLLLGCELTVNKPTIFNAQNEYFEFTCGSKLRLIMEDGTAKFIENCHFDGTNTADNMIVCSGDFTGATGPNSANTSKLEFINCAFDRYHGIALHLLHGRATLVNGTFSPFVTKSYPATGIFVSPTARLDAFGCSFSNHDIAIDANHGQLFIGTQTANYKGNTISSASFTNNAIGIHTAATSSVIANTSFNTNDAAIIQLSGTINIETLKQNYFIGNANAIIFSGGLNASQGQNRFINNTKDITFIMPDNQLSPVAFNVRCNLWQHGLTYNQPVFDVKCNQYFDVCLSQVNFIYKPYLEYKTPSILTCTGTKKKEDNEDTVIFSYQSLYHDNYLKISELIGKNEFKESYHELQLLMKDADNIKLPAYPNRYDTVNAYREALLKNTFFSYAEKKAYTENYQTTFIGADTLEYILNKLSPMPYPGRNIYGWLTKDHLEFLTFFLNGKGMQAGDDGYFTKPEISGENAAINIFPNPFSDNARIDVIIPGNDFYTLDIYNNIGVKIYSIIENQKLSKGKQQFIADGKYLTKGIYLVVLRNSAYTWLVKRKLIFIQ